MANEKSWAASAAARRKVAEDKFWAAVSETHKQYDFRDFRYLGATTASTVQCPHHGPFQTKPTYLLAGSGCPICGKTKSATARKLGLAGFIAQARRVHGGRYEYPTQDYSGNKTKVRILCPDHGEYWQTPNSHLNGRGCPECANDLKRQRNKAVSLQTLRELPARLAAGNANWTYDFTTFTGMNRHLRAHCSIHGEFHAAPNNILRNSGCAKCGVDKHQQFAESRKLTTEEWVARAKKQHGDKYDYADSVYVGAETRTSVRCRTHGVFYTTTDHIYQATGCPKCSHHLSRGEDAVFRFLSNLTTAEQRNRTVLKPKELDIYLPEAKMAVEYCGEFWHSHGDAEDERKNKLKHFQKYADCKAQGIRLITLYETEWKEHNYAVRRLLRNAVGKSKGKLMARKCELRKVTTQEARPFYDRYHPQGGSGHGEHYALFWKGKMVACMRFVHGANDRGAGAAKRVWTLGRYATRINVAGAASRLFKAFVQEYNPPVVKSFSDNRFFEGGMYEQLGFVLEAEVEPDYQVWHPKLGTKPKPHYQRRAIPRRIAEIGSSEVFDPETDQRTEAQITYALGARRLYDCGKKRWVGTPTT